VHDRDQLRLGMIGQRLDDLIVGHRLPERRAQLDHVQAVPLGDVDHAVAEEAAGCHDHGLARLGQRRQAGLHAGRAACGERDRESVAAAVGRLQQLDQVLQDLVEVGVEMAQHRPLHGLEHARVDVGRARTAQQALGRVEWCRQVAHRTILHHLRSIRQ
jgi:hypothetical protein